MLAKSIYYVQLKLKLHLDKAFKILADGHGKLHTYSNTVSKMLAYSIKHVQRKHHICSNIVLNNAK